ncbi:hypothetical protein C8R44DRAFT_739486 [Mycena epipterygia]|nr:hypothetical protein C8R44DRAFT_739486 [Mycena epipterygia]
MSMPTCQQEAERLIADLRAIKKGDIDKKSYQWPSIDYDQVSTETCQELCTLLAKTTHVRGYRVVTPETPRHVKITRHINAVLAEREYLVKRRILAAQALDERIRGNMEPIFRFLRIARRTQGEQFTFPNEEPQLLQCLGTLRAALSGVEDMIRGQSDLEETARDRGWGRRFNFDG